MKGDVEEKDQAEASLNDDERGQGEVWEPTKNFQVMPVRASVPSLTLFASPRAEALAIQEGLCVKTRPCASSTIGPIHFKHSSWMIDS